MDIHIRKATPHDLPEMQDLYVETIRHTCKNDYTPEQQAAWISSIENHKRWQEAISGQYFLVAEKDHKIAGFASLQDNDYVDFLYVHQNHQRQGIADRLYHELEEKSRSSGVSSLTSDVSLTARPFFERKGFRVLKENKLVIKGIEITNFKMIKHFFLSGK